MASTTLHEPLPWQNSKLLAGDAAEAVAQLRNRPGKDLVILGSGKLAQALMAADLIDEFILLIHPLVLGSGHRLFEDGGTLAIAAARRLEDDPDGCDDRDVPAGRREGLSRHCRTSTATATGPARG